MAQGLLEGYSFVRVPAQHFGEEIDTTVSLPSKDVLKVILAICAVLFYLLPEVSLLFLEKLLPVFLGRIANHLANYLKLMRFSITLKQGHALPQKLSDDAANGPHINCPSIFLDLQ